MWARITSNEILPKALRLILVFSLVFWVSFRVECLAFADLLVDSGDHEGQVITEMKVYELKASDNKYELGKLLGETGKEIGEQDPALEMKANDEMTIVAVSSWKDKPDEGGSGEGGEGGEEGGSSGGSSGGDDEGGSSGSSSGGDDEGGSSGGSSGGDDEGGSSGGSSGDEGGNTGGDEGGSGDNTGGDNTGGNTGGSEDTGNEDNTGGADDNKKDEGKDSGGDTKGAPAPPMSTQAEDEDITLSKFVKWSVDKEDVVKVEPDEYNETATLKAVGEGTATVTCSLADDFDNSLIAEDFEGEFKVQFKVKVAASAYVSSIVLYTMPKDTGRELQPREKLTLTDKERESYSFWALVNVKDDSSDEPVKYEILPGDSLNEKSGGQLEDLKWAVLTEDGEEVGEDVAKITGDGVLTLTGDGPVLVRCRSENGLSGDPFDQFVIVSSEKAEQGEQDEQADIQGKNNPQPELTVTVDDPSPATDEAAENSGASADPENSAASAEASSGTNENAEGAGNEGENSNQSPEGTEGAEGEAAQHKLTSKKYTADDDGSLVEVLESGEHGEPLGAQTKTYTMNTASGTTTVEGRGSNLAMLLDSAGVSMDDQTRVDTVEFVSAETGSTSIKWSDLVAVSANYIMVAPKSYVHELDGVKATKKSEGGEGGSSTPENGEGGENSTTPENSSESSSSPESVSPASENSSSSVSTQADEPDGGSGEGADPVESGQGGSSEGENVSSGGSEPSGNTDGGETGGSGDADNTGANSEGGNNEGGAQEGGDQSGSTDSTDLLPNTRFRILYEASNSSIDPLSLCHINQIIVHLSEPEKPKDITDPELDIHIDYTPVPKGRTAFLSAVPNNKVGASRFGYTWEISTDKGKNWKVYTDESVQTLRVDTEDPPAGHIGDWFRVILETDLMNPDGTPRGATSKPVEIKASDEFAVLLDYVPPIAGDDANFEAHLYNVPSGVNENTDLTFVWEYNQGNGWEQIPGADQKSKSWRTRTNAIEESAPSDSSSDSDAGAQIMTYIRVRVIAPGHEPITSNTQPLTVQVGESSGGKADDINDALNGKTGDGKDEDEGDDSDDGDSEGTATKPSTGRSTPTIREIDAPTVENDSSSIADHIEQTPTDPTTTGNKSEIVISDTVSAKVKEQNEAAKSKTPGARWTEISALNPTDDDMQRIFANNPFAPFAIPTGLGIIFAGGLEKLLVFRRQL